MWRRLSNGRSAELVGVAQPIVRCGEIGGIGRRRDVSERRMWAPFVVVVSPFGDRRSGMIEAEEQGFVQEFVAHAAVEALAEAVLHGLARCDVVPFHPM